eukprot:CAMPEP_0196153312 /NCGR_PEP_ID=MMETSP0910-20130528/36989_1 /TAXON_ID=49265 /ORGANISM="Thalassiosira rotula, Strain GSO102" /LENGTH=207 /DNA_ID=CAMNT_0041417105 /DNA_START=112 /DNA_END=732 /DNA_ORIENTATION=-
MSDANETKPTTIETNDDSTTTTTPKIKKFSWPPLESNPEVFTTYLQSIGLPTTFSIGEVFGFDEDLLAFIPQPVLGIIVCLERIGSKSQYNSLNTGSAENYDKVSYYMHQSKALDNACGIIACLHAVFNSPVVSTDPCSILGKYRLENETTTPMEKCKSLESNTEFQNIHKAHASRGQSRTIDSDQSKVRHHFIAYALDKEGKRLVE